MSNFQVDRKLIFTSSDLLRPRNAVEKEKIDNMFPQFSFFMHNGNLGVKGRLKTSYGNHYTIRIETSGNYPYHLPNVELVDTAIESDCPHRYMDNLICVLKADQWTSTFSLAFLVAKAALWLNKYDYWQRNGEWPGNEQAH